MTAGTGTTLREERVVRALMRGRYKYYNGRSDYVRNILAVSPDDKRPTNFLFADILEFLIRNRKARIDFSLEGYALAETIVMRMTQLGYDEDDAFSGLKVLVNWNLVEPESLLLQAIGRDDPVRAHASGFIHMRYFLSRAEYLVGITTDMSFSSREAAESIAAIWAGQAHRQDLSLNGMASIAKILERYLVAEYDRRCRRHAFYRDLGYGGKLVVEAAGRASEHLDQITARFRGSSLSR